MPTTIGKQAFEDTLLTALDLLWADTSPVAHENVAFDGDLESGGHVRVWFVTLFARGYIGSDVVRREGRISIDVYYPVALALAGGYDLADKALQFFETYQPGAHERTLRNPTLQEMGATGGSYLVSTHAEFAYYHEATT